MYDALDTTKNKGNLYQSSALWKDQKVVYICILWPVLFYSSNCCLNACLAHIDSQNAILKKCLKQRVHVKVWIRHVYLTNKSNHKTRERTRKKQKQTKCKKKKQRQLKDTNKNKTTFSYFYIDPKISSNTYAPWRHVYLL